MKQQIADRVELHFDLLPYETEFLEYLQQEHRSGRRLILATASNHAFADGVAAHLGIFETAMGSSPTENNSGSRKLARIRALLEGQPFAYAANAAVDLPIWKEADGAVLVNASGSVQSRAESISKVMGVFDGRNNFLLAFIKAMRPHQWLKNLLIFVPLILTRQFGDMQMLMQTVLAFTAFSLCASSVYILNDLLDLPADRQHPRKRKRPFASGDLPILYGVAGKILLLLISMLIALTLPPYFFPVLLLYYGCTMAYSLWLKRAALIDAVMLACLYTLRLIAGAAAIFVAPTFWLLAFSMFLFMSLALIKRYSELRMVQMEGKDQLIGRAYQAVDTETLAQLGSASGYLAVLVLAFYINSDTVYAQYARPEALWLLCPMMMYWISRMWLITRRGDMHDDPVVFTIRDKRTYSLGLFAVLAFLCAVYWPFVRSLITPFLPGL
jgi:4-hydroxybenzoate polyprenyltransferase